MHAWVLNAVIHAQSILPHSHQTNASQTSQLLRDVRLAFARHGGQMADALFIRTQRVQQSEAGRV